MRVVCKTAAVLTMAACVFLFSFMGSYYQKLPDCLYVRDGEALFLSPVFEPLSAKAVPASLSLDAPLAVELTLFGVIPVKQVTVTQISAQEVWVCGTPFGIKLLTDGVLVIGLSSIDTSAGAQNPGSDAGVKKGDILLTLDGTRVSSNRQVAEIVAKSDGRALPADLRRGNVSYSANLLPVKSAVDGSYKLGLWVRDSTAGIGTMTFYDPVSGVFGGLGHAVCDVDTGEVMPLKSGEILSVSITGALKGTAGEPGELRGSFSAAKTCGTLSLNRETGVYGTLYEAPTAGFLAPVALRQEITQGEAVVYVTLEGQSPKEYTVSVERVNLTDGNPTRNMIIRVTDPALLSATGGIVQGMSGSPILQNGRFIGAITHVFVNDPTCGYGIFAENMLDTARTLELNALAKVS